MRTVEITIEEAMKELNRISRSIIGAETTYELKGSPRKAHGELGIVDFKNDNDFMTKLYSISEAPCFNDDIRNKAQDVFLYIDSHENKPIILKSGETWVVEYEGIDYLAIGGVEAFSMLGSGLRREEVFEEDLQANDGIWKPISEITITDEIAKLRPMMTRNIKSSIDLRMLYAIQPFNRRYVIHGDMPNSARSDDPIDWRLATVKDLKRLLTL